MGHQGKTTSCVAHLGVRQTGQTFTVAAHDAQTQRWRHGNIMTAASALKQALQGATGSTLLGSK